MDEENQLINNEEDDNNYRILNCCGRKYRIKHKKSFVVNNEYAIYLSMIYYNFQKFYKSNFLKELTEFNINFLSVVGTLSLPIVFFRLLYLYVTESDSNTTIISDCLMKGLECKTIENHCSTIYNKNKDLLESPSWLDSTNAKNKIKDCIKDNIELNNTSLFIWIFDSILWIIYLYILVVIIFCIYKIGFEIYKIARIKLQKAYIENVPDIEEMV